MQKQETSQISNPTGVLPSLPGNPTQTLSPLFYTPKNGTKTMPPPRFLLSPTTSTSTSPSPPFHSSLIAGFAAGALSAAFACLLFFSLHQCALRLRHHRHQTPPPPPPPPPLHLHNIIPITIYSKKDDNEEETSSCSVCLWEYEVGEELRELPQCNHVFHRECIDRWFATGSRLCPVCRGRVLDEEEEREVEVVRLHNVGLGRQLQLL